MTTRVYMPRDAGALSVGAEAVARAIAAEAAIRGMPLTVVRNGSRGLYWLEPLVEVETPAGRVAYGPVRVATFRAYSRPDFSRGAGTRSPRG